MTSTFGYFDVREVQNNQFKQFPMILSDKRSQYYELSNEAKMAYMFMKDRFSLSLSHGWFDDHGHVYIYMTIVELCELLNVGETKAKKTRRELVEVGLLKSVGQGLNMPSRLYIGQLDLTIKPAPKADGHNTTVQETQSYQGGSQYDRPEGRNTTAIYTDNTKTEYNDTNRYEKPEMKLSNSEIFEMGDFAFLTDRSKQLLANFGTDAKKLANKIFESKRAVERQYQVQLQQLNPISDDAQLLGELFANDVEREIEKLVFKYKTGYDEGKPLNDLIAYFYTQVFSMWQLALALVLRRMVNGSEVNKLDYFYSVT
ncbi:replication initiator protein A [Leuconostoc pseudomesenteroides]|uniref:replication initiator protein A n=1 Tax=Leuconostoc pseudomesenteroides TaxID=33968 RepID=UPI0039ED1977